MIENKSTIYQRLIRNIKINKTNGCWEWQGSKRNGYGRMIIGSRTDGTRKTVSTHRLSYELHYGEIPQGMEICHKCNNPCCINPDHLFAGTRQDNIDDRERKGRNNPPKGEKHAKAKLTEADVLQDKLDAKLRKLYADDFVPFSERYPMIKKCKY